MAALALTSSAYAAGPVTVPIQFRGEWNADLSACETGLSDSRLRIGTRDVRFYESAGPVERVMLKSESDIEMVVTLSGEGERWTDTVHFRLSEDGNTLTAVMDDGSRFMRYRCGHPRR